MPVELISMAMRSSLKEWHPKKPRTWNISRLLLRKKEDPRPASGKILNQFYVAFGCFLKLKFPPIDQITEIALVFVPNQQVAFTAQQFVQLPTGMLTKQVLWETKHPTASMLGRTAQSLQCRMACQNRRINP